MNAAPFNVRIPVDGEELTFTIIPEGKAFKVVYFGGILGAIEKRSDSWKPIDADRVPAGDLPLYQFDPLEHPKEVVLNGVIAIQLGEAIEDTSQTSR